MKKAPNALEVIALTALTFAVAGTARAGETEERRPNFDAETVPIAALNPLATPALQDTEDRLREFDRITAVAPSASEAVRPSPSLSTESELFPPTPPTLATSTVPAESPRSLPSGSPRIENELFPATPKTLAASTTPTASPRSLPSGSSRIENELFPAAPKTLAASTAPTASPRSLPSGSSRIENELFPAAPQTLAASTAPTASPRTVPRNQVAQRRRANPSNLPAGIYGALSGDFRILRKAQLQGLAVSGVGTIGTGSADFFSGFGINAAVGYKSLQNNLRVEAQLAYGQNELGTVDLPAIASRSIPATTVGGKGSISTFTGFLNAYYDLNTGSNWQPYIGGGIGLTRLSSNGISLTYPGTSLTASVDDARWGFAYQIMAGTAYYLSPQSAVTLGYRYFDPLGGNTFDTPLGEVRFKDGGAHNFEFGVRYFF